jgi:Heparinase II/III-like protein/Heparinase II/III N-terminus
MAFEGHIDRQRTAARLAGSMRVAYELWRQYGTGNVLYRAAHTAARKSGWLKRRFPSEPWGASPLRDLLLGEVPIDPGQHVEHRRSSGRVFFFEIGALPGLEASWAMDARSRAEAVMSGRLTHLQPDVSRQGGAVDWLIDPVSGRRADTRRHWCDRDEFEARQGDIRALWEASRFGWVFPLVRAYAATSDGRYANMFWNLLESWMRANPPNMGPNWQCGQECAIRIMSTCFGFFGFLAAPQTQERHVALALELLARHGERVARNLRFARTQMGNHAVTEAAGIYTLGVLFPEFHGAAAWRRDGLRILEDEARKFIAPDGSYVQHSMTYHRLMMQDYLWVIALAELNGDHLSLQTLGRLEASAHFLYQMQEESNGRMPNYGANDGSLLLPLNGCDYGDYRPAIASMYHALSRRRVYPPGPWDEDLRWLFREPGHATEDPPRRRSLRFAEGGYFTLRGRDTWAMIRCHAFRTRPSQSDQLHLDLWWKGQNLLRDSGSYSYHADPPWDGWFASTAAHNTVSLSGQDQMVRVRRFTWIHLSRGRPRRFRSDEMIGLDYLEGEQNGYRRLASRATHCRAVLRLGEHHWFIVDDVWGTGWEKATVHWQLMDVPYTVGDQSIVLQTPAGRAMLTSFVPKGAAKQVTGRGCVTSRPMGWQSHRYGLKTAAPAVSLTVEGPLPQRIITSITLGDESTIHMKPGSDGAIWSCEQPSGTYVVEIAALSLGSSPVVARVTHDGAQWLPAAADRDRRSRGEQ